MANKIRIKRRVSGNAGAPASLENAELAFNEVDDVLYYGEGTGGQDGTATTILAIGGSGAFLTLSGDQTVTGNKTVNGNTTFNGIVIVPAPSSNGHAATKLYVDQLVANASSTFTAAGDSGTVSIAGGDTFTISGGTGLTSVAAATDTVTINLDNTAVTAASYGAANTVATFTVDAQGRLTAAANSTISIASSQVTDFTEGTQDAAASLFTNGTHSGIAATYDDANSKLNLNVADFTITLGGDLTGSVTVTDLANATLTATIAANSVALGTDTTGDYVGSVAAGTGITLSNTGTEGGTFTVTNAGVTSVNGSTGSITGVVTTADSGTVTSAMIANGTIVDEDINASAAIALSKLANGTSAQVPVANSSGVLTYVTLSGDVTIAANGLTTIAANSVALGTDTTGNYVGSVSAGTGVDVSNTNVEGGTFTVGLANTAVTAGSYGSAGAVGTFSVDAQGRLTAAGNSTISITASQISDRATNLVTGLTGTANEITVSNSGVGAVTLSLPANVTISNNLTVTGDLTVQGNTTTLNTATLTVEDKNVVLANVATPTDTTADGAGISVLGDSTKTFNWVDSTDSWTSSEHVDLASTKVFKIAGTTVLSGTNLDNVTVDGGTF